MLRWLTLLFIATCSHQASAATSCGSPQSAAQCMICACYNEAGGESQEGMRAVGKAVMSRVKSGKYKPTVCGVVWQEGQFSWTSGRGRSVPSNHACQKIGPEMLSFKDTWPDSFRSGKAKADRGCRYAFNVDNHRFYYCAVKAPGVGAKTTASKRRTGRVGDGGK